MKKLRYGMVGGGPDAFIGAAHRMAIRLDDTAELTAGCFSRSPEKCRQAGQALGIDPDRCYETYRQMAEAEAAREDGVDFVVVVTPNVSHYEICKAFLEAGIHVSCDKPLCLTSLQADELVRLAEEKELLFLVTYTYTGQVTARHVRAIIRDGKIGRVRTVMAEYPQGWLADPNDWGGKQGAWRCDPAQSGGVNCLGDLGTHIENMVATMTGLRIRRVLAKLDTLVPGRVLDDNDVVLVEYEGGATGTYWSSQCAIGHGNDLRVRIYGETGSILWATEEPEEVILVDAQGIQTRLRRGQPGVAPEAARYGRLPAGHVEGWIEGMGNLYRSFAACIRAKQDCSFTPEMIDFPTVRDGREGVRFIEACLRSNAAGNAWEEL